MKIDFSKLNYKFIKKPLLVGGKSMEYYGLRKAGDDIDFIAYKEDVEALIQNYPRFVKDLWGDFGLKVYGLEIWKTIDYLYYEDYIESAIEEDNYFVISLKDLLYQKAMVMHKPKYLNDLKLVVKKNQEIEGEKYKLITNENQEIVNSLPELKYLEKVGPKE